MKISFGDKDVGFEIERYSGGALDFSIRNKWEGEHASYMLNTDQARQLREWLSEVTK